MEEIKEMKRECIDIGRALFRGLEENRIIVDLHYKDAYIKTVIEDGKKIQKKFPAYKAEKVELKLDNNNDLINRFKSLRKRSLIWISYKKENPLGYNTDDITVLNFITNSEYKSRKKKFKKCQEKIFKR